MKHLYKITAIFLFASTAAMGQYTGGYPNVASYKTATASETVAGFGPENAVDSLLTSYCSVTGAIPAWLQVDLASYHYIKGFEMVIPNAGELPRSVTFQVSADGTSWLGVRDVTVGAEGTYSYNVSTEPKRYVRFYITDKDALATFADVKVYGQYVAPPNNVLSLPATNITTEGFTANWNERTRADGYILIVAHDPDRSDRLPGYGSKDVGNVLSWEVPDLEPASTYYYSVRAYNLNGTSGSVNTIGVMTLKLPQTITFEPLPEKTYGDVPFELSATASSGLPVSFISSADTVASVNGTTVSIAGTGTAEITANQYGDALYDTAAPVTQALVVNVKELSVDGTTAADKVYDGTDIATLSGSVLTGVVGDDDVALADETTGVFAQIDVGTDIEVSNSITITGDDINNYLLVPLSSLTADITGKELVVTADDKSREACDVNPVFTVGLSGFAGNEDESVLTGIPTAACAADKESPAGTYEISVSGGTATNYIFTYVSGSLTITPDVTSPVLSVRDISVQLDENGGAVITPEQLVEEASDNCGVADITLSQDIFTSSDIGDVSVEVVVTDDAGNSSSAVSTVTVSGPDGVLELTQSGIQLFPNPTRGKLEMVADSPAETLKVLDMTGRTIIERSDLNSYETIDLSGNNDGIYIFQFRSGEKLIHMKVIKK